MKLAFIVCLLSMSPALAASPAGGSSGLPTGARVLRSAALPGSATERVVVYDDGGTVLGVTEVTNGQTDLVWKEAIPGSVRALILPGSPGLFLVVTRRTLGGSAYAYRVSGGRVRSAIEGHRAGRVFGDEGVVILRDGFRIREKDGSHRGSIPYRIVTEYILRGSRFVLNGSWRTPDMPPSAYPKPNAVFHTDNRSTILLKLEVANTEAQRETGLMFRRSLDPDSGMVFVWQQPVQESFWMENTYIPLTVAFVGADDRIQEMQDMQPLTCDLHTPAKPYLYAIEANLGFFARNGIDVGDPVTFDLSGGSPPGPTPATGPSHPCTLIASVRQPAVR